MAVYTDISEEELANFLTAYNVGTLMSYRGIAEGVENSNFMLHTSEGQFILTLYEKRVDPGDLPFFLGLMQHLAGNGLSCPLPLARNDGALLFATTEAITAFTDDGIISIRQARNKIMDIRGLTGCFQFGLSGIQFGIE